MLFKKLILRLTDILLSIFFLIVSLPIFCLISIIIKLTDGGPVFFKHLRVSANGKEFIAIKFRTMVVNAEDILKNNPNIFSYPLKNDPRFTPIGLYLRKTNLNELPIFLNYLRGDLSLISNINNTSIASIKLFRSNPILPPLYTLLTSSLVSKRLLLLSGFVAIGVIYYIISSTNDLFLNFIIGIFSTALLLDVILIKYRYKKRCYGTSAQELLELESFLEANFKRKEFQDWDGKGPLYPAVKEVIEDEEYGYNGATIKA